MKRFVLVICVAALTPSLYAQRTVCDYEGGGPFFLTAGQDERGYFIRLSDSEETRGIIKHRPDFQASVAKGLLPPHSSYWPQAEYLARHGGATVFCAGPGTSGRGPEPAQILVPLALDGVWRGTDPLSCLRSFAQAAGLEVVVPQPGLWLTGPPELVRQAALLVFAYPMDATLQPLQDGTTARDLELAFLARLPIRQFAPPIQRHDKTWDLSPALIGLGYYAVPGEPDTYLVVATQGTFTNPSAGPEQLTTLAAKLHIRRDAGKLTVDCLWTKSPNGPLVPGIQEDLDGDGLQDFYFEAAGGVEKPDLIVSGADGTVIAQVITDNLAVEKGVNGPKRFSVKGLWEQPGKAKVYRFNPERKELEAVGRREAAVNAARGKQGGAFYPFDWPSQAMKAELGSLDRVKVYCFGDTVAPHTPDMDFVRLRSSPVWRWFVDKNPRDAIDQVPPDLPVHAVFKYLSPGYIAEREKEKATKSK